VPRGMAALGYTLNTPEENKYLMQKHELIAEIDVLLGGRAAEEVFIGEISTGASNDLERATDMIKAMVKVYGMSDVAGLMVLEKQQNQFLGGGYGSTKDYSEKTAEAVDEYIRGLLADRYKEVKFKLNEYKEVIEEMVKELHEKEVISGEEVTELIEKYSPHKQIKVEDEENRDNS
jgi:cell division protease FtsH